MKPDDSPKAKLSNNLLADYGSYKRNTAVLVRWLIDNVDTSRAKSRTLSSVKKLMHLALMVKDRDLTIPSHVLQALKSSIKKRGKITAFFKSMQDGDHADEDEITRSHEHFTSTLVDILKILQRDVPIKSLSANSIEADPPLSQTTKSSNIFEVLGVEDVETEDRLEGLAITEETTPFLHAPRPPFSQAADEHKSIEDDPLADIVEIFMIVLEMDAICSAVKSTWEQAGAGLIPVVLASWISSAALKGVERWLAGTTNHLQVSEHGTLFSKYVVRLRMLDVELRPSSDIAPKHTPFTTGHGLRTAWLALEDFKSSRQYNERLMGGRLFEKPANHITVQKDFFDGPRQTEAEHITMDLMLKTMKQLLSNKDDASGDFVFDINPLLVDVKNYIESNSNSMTTGLVFGMQLLVESFKSFMFCDETIQGVNCRTLALKFALEVKRSLDAVIANAEKESTACLRHSHSCGSPDVHLLLLSFKLDLDDYVGQTRFDLYYQTPWVAGQHMQEILSLATDFGLRLSDQENYLTATLHLYNLLVQLKILDDKVPLLESLCSSLRDMVFMGTRPSQNYHSYFIRCLGGRVDFSKSSDHHAHGWQLKMPVRKGSEPHRRLIPGQISRFYDIENIRYAIDIDRWTSIYQAKKEAKATRQEKDRINERIHCNSFAISLLQLKDYAAPEFSGDFPIARINYFAIHLACIRILEKIALLGEYSLLTETKPPLVRMGMQFVKDLFRKVDEDQQDSFMKRMLPFLRSLRISKEALIEVLQGKPVSDFIWQGIGALKG